MSEVSVLKTRTVRGYERQELVRWRQASHVALNNISFSANQFTEFLKLGGPDAIKGLRATIKKLQGELSQVQGERQVERYRALQADLKERDLVNAALRRALTEDYGVSDTAIDEIINKRVIKEDRIYGSSRELLLRENKVLRAQLEQRAITTRTWRDMEGGAAGVMAQVLGQPGSPVKGAGVGGVLLPPGSPGVHTTYTSTSTLPLSPSHHQVPAAQPVFLQPSKPGSASSKSVGVISAHMEVVKGLVAAGEELRQAERGYVLPEMAHAETQADDGSQKLIKMLEGQVTLLAAQKLQLIQKVSDLEAAAALAEKKYEAAKDEAAEARRQKTELMLHQDNLSRDVRSHLASEAARADAAELSAQEAHVERTAAQRLADDRQQQLGEAMAALKATQAALHEKTQQVELLQHLYQDLKSAVHAVGDTLVVAHDETGSRVLAALEAMHKEHAATLAGAINMTAEARQMAELGARQSSAVMAQQRALAGEVAASRDLTGAALTTLQGQLAEKAQALAASDRERRAVTRQMVAGNLLGRLQDRRHAQAISMLRSDMPVMVADKLSGDLRSLQQQGHEIAGDVALANEQLAQAVNGRGMPGVGQPSQAGSLPEHPEGPPDETITLIGASRQLRAALGGLLSAGDSPGPPGSSLSMLQQHPLIQPPTDASIRALSTYPLVARGMMAAAQPVAGAHSAGSGAKEAGPSAASRANTPPRPAAFVSQSAGIPTGSAQLPVTASVSGGHMQAPRATLTEGGPQQLQHAPASAHPPASAGTSTTTTTTNNNSTVTGTGAPGHPASGTLHARPASTQAHDPLVSNTAGGNRNLAGVTNVQQQQQQPQSPPKLVPAWAIGLDDTIGRQLRAAASPRPLGESYEQPHYQHHQVSSDINSKHPPVQPSHLQAHQHLQGSGTHKSQEEFGGLPGVWWHSDGPQSKGSQGLRSQYAALMRANRRPARAPDGTGTQHHHEGAEGYGPAPSPGLLSPPARHFHAAVAWPTSRAGGVAGPAAVQSSTESPTKHVIPSRQGDDGFDAAGGVSSTVALHGAGVAQLGSEAGPEVLGESMSSIPDAPLAPLPALTVTESPR